MWLPFSEQYTDSSAQFTYTACTFKSYFIFHIKCIDCSSPCFFFIFYQYYYSVRVFAGQEPSGIWVGWITPDYHQYDHHFDMNKVRNVTVTVGDDKGNIHDRY